VIYFKVLSAPLEVEARYRGRATSMRDTPCGFVDSLAVDVEELSAT
jgi:hypothetical protein